MIPNTIVTLNTLYIEQRMCTTDDDNIFIQLEVTYPNFSYLNFHSSEHPK